MELVLSPPNDGRRVSGEISCFCSGNSVLPCSIVEWVVRRLLWGYSDRAVTVFFARNRSCVWSGKPFGIFHDTDNTRGGNFKSSKEVFAMKHKLVLAFLACLVVMVCFSGGYAKPFYQGKKMTLVVATRPGGGYDFYGRLMARFMEKYLPGSTIIVRNIPGAGHIIGCNEIYRSKPNGLTFGVFNRGLPLAQVAGLKGVKFDLSKMSWLGSAGIDPLTFFISPNTPFKTLEDTMKAERVVVATPGAGTEGHIVPLLFARMAGLNNFKFVSGYMGAEAELAMVRGEIHGQFASWSSLLSFHKDGNAVPLMFVAKEPIKGYEDVPVIQDVIKEERYKPLITLMFSVSLLGRPFAGPPNIPQDRLQPLREAFGKALHDSELVEIAKRADRPIQYTTGEEAAELTKSMLAFPPELAKLVEEAYGVK